MVDALVLTQTTPWTELLPWLCTASCGNQGFQDAEHNPQSPKLLPVIFQCSKHISQRMEVCHWRVKLEKVLSFMIYLENSGDLYSLHHTTVRLIYTQKLSSKSWGEKTYPGWARFSVRPWSPQSDRTCVHPPYHSWRRVGMWYYRYQALHWTSRQRKGGEMYTHVSTQILLLLQLMLNTLWPGVFFLQKLMSVAGDFLDKGYCYGSSQ